MDRRDFLNRPDALSASGEFAAALPELRRYLCEAGYDEGSISAALGHERIGEFDPQQPSIYHQHQLGETRLDGMIRLFLLALPLSEAQLRATLAEQARDTAIGAGLILPDGDGGWRSPVCLCPVEDRLYATDWYVEPDDDLAYAALRVMPLGNDSRELAALARSAAPDSALDLCTGSGVIAIEAALTGASAVGVDINPRAVAFARFNALLNGASGASFAEGDLFAPVGDARFELVTVNPPFVPTPHPPELLFRDGGPSGEEVLSRVIHEVADHLEPGGVCAVKTDLVYQAAAPYDEKLLGWLGHDAPGVQALILGHAGRTPQTYVLAHAGGSDEAAVLAWLAHYRDQGITEIADGFIFLRCSEEAAPPRARRLPLGQFNLGALTHRDVLALFERIDALDRGEVDDQRHFALRCRFGPVELLPEGPWGGLLVSFPLAHALATLGDEGQPLSVEALIERLSGWGFELTEHDVADLRRTVGRMWWAGYVG